MEPEQNRLDLRDYVLAIKRRRYWMIGVAVAGIVATALLAFLLPARFRSSGTILIEQQELPTDLVRSTVTSYADQRIKVIEQRVMTTKNLLDIIRRYDLYPKARARESRESLMTRMREDIGIDMISADVIDPRSGMPREATIAFAVSYTSRSPEQAMRVANELTTLFLNENLAERTRLAQDASTFLDAEANRISQNVDELEAKLAAFKEKSGNSLPELSTLNMTLLDRTEQDLRTQEAHLSSLEQQRVYLEAQLAQVKPNSAILSETGERILSPADRLKTLRSQLASAKALYSEDYPDIIRMQREIAGLEAEEGGAADSAAPDVQRQLDDARTRLAEAQRKYAPEHPDVQRLEREVKSLEAGLEQEQSRPVNKPAVEPDNPAYIQLQASLSATVHDIDATRSQVNALRAQRDDYQRNITLSPKTEKEYRELARDYQNAQLKYQEIRSKQMEAQVAQNLETDRKGERFTLIEPPLPPEEPVSPNRAAIWIVGVLMSLALAAGIAVLLEKLDATVRGRKDMLQLFSEAPLALIPDIGTPADARATRQRRKYALGAAAVTALSMVIAVHFVYRPLDVLWFSIMRKMGM